jgi:hypothetical protein
MPRFTDSHAPCDILTYIIICKQSYMHTYVHACMHTYIHILQAQLRNVTAEQDVNGILAYTCIHIHCNIHTLKVHLRNLTTEPDIDAEIRAYTCINIYIHTLQVHLRNVTAEPDVDVEILARGTPGFTGADISNMYVSLMYARIHLSFWVQTYQSCTIIQTCSHSFNFTRGKRIKHVHFTVHVIMDKLVEFLCFPWVFSYFRICVCIYISAYLYTCIPIKVSKCQM